MAIRCSPLPIFPRTKANEASPTRLCTLTTSQMKPTRTAALVVKSSTVNKVFEDQALGIVCYRDEHGEVICEGYDEGPRYSQQASPAVHHESFQPRKGGFQIPDFVLPRPVRTIEGLSVRRFNGFAAAAAAAPTEEHDTQH